MGTGERFRICHDPIDGAAVAALVSAPDCGAVSTFLGLVRNHNAGRSVLYLDYEAFEPLALKAFEQIDSEARERWPSVRLAIHHRVGRLEIREASVIIVACSAHRQAAYDASIEAINRLKKVVPIWKKRDQ